MDRDWLTATAKNFRHLHADDLQKLKSAEAELARACGYLLAVRETSARSAAMLRGVERMEAEIIVEHVDGPEDIRVVSMCDAS